VTSRLKIAIITPSLGSGGAERVSSLISIFMSDLGYAVTIFAAYPNIDFPYKGNYVYLGHSKSNTKVYFTLVTSFLKLYRSIKKENFDFVIDFRSRRIFWIECIFHLFIFRQVKHTIFTVHLPLLNKYIPKPWLVFGSIYRRAFALVSVSDVISKSLNELGYSNITGIKNAVNFDNIDKLKEESIIMDKPFVIAAGRMDDNIKRFNHVIEAYAASGLSKAGIHLFILGDGVVKKQLIALVDELKCAEFVHFKGFQQNPFKYFKKAKFFILASEFEGFPMVLIESLACGTPVVSYDCPTGPSEIIQNENNGLLVENGNIDELTSAITRMHKDIVLYKTCRANAVKSVKHLSFENIKSQWQKLIESANS
jgi:glycosyltransferase involved in cell wall biosynthesis